MNRWLRQPQQVGLRKIQFQIHLWLGLALGVYLVILSLSGSLLVYRIELNRELGTHLPAYDQQRAMWTQQQIRSVAEARYPGYDITYVTERVTPRSPAFTVTAQRGEDSLDRFFDPYTGEDLGPTFTTGQRAVLWLVSLHDELLLGRTGRWWNGLFAGIFTLLIVTGIILWWPGIGRWKRSLTARWIGSWKRFSWDLHSALGIWLCVFMLMWGVSGFYLGIPGPFTQVADLVSDPDAAQRPADDFLAWLARIHFGRFRGNSWSAWLKATWAVIGIVPALLFATGSIMWWNRVAQPRLRRAASPGRQDSTGAELA